LYKNIWNIGFVFVPSMINWGCCLSAVHNLQVADFLYKMPCFVYFYVVCGGGNSILYLTFCQIFLFFYGWHSLCILNVYIDLNIKISEYECITQNQILSRW
jgi:hypothetical protein